MSSGYKVEKMGGGLLLKKMVFGPTFVERDATYDIQYPFKNSGSLATLQSSASSSS